MDQRSKSKMDIITKLQTLELQTPETMKLFNGTKNLIDKTKKGRKCTKS